MLCPFENPQTGPGTRVRARARVGVNEISALSHEGEKLIQYPAKRVQFEKKEWRVGGRGGGGGEGPQIACTPRFRRMHMYDTILLYVNLAAHHSDEADLSPALRGR